MKQSKNAMVISEWPEKTLFSRHEVTQILGGIGLSTLDSLITYEELPRTIIHKRVFIHRKDLENYITNCRQTTTGRCRND